MGKLGILAGLAVVVALLAGGCAGSQITYTQTTSIYSTMDSTSLVYTNPRAASPANDHPLRWMAFLLNPVGVAMDYGVNRPVYFVGSLFPGLFGYTSEDAMVSSQRWSLFNP
ncbi:MAG TPA: hypothetical protein VJM82_02130 [Nitrospiraceae bacterium]|nr:hypothetical protein [Nitrospiraceae bacterium]